MSAVNYYTVLGVTKNTSDEELKKAYRRECRKWHPDFNIGNEEAKLKFIEITEAYREICKLRAQKKDKFSIKNIFVPQNDTDVKPKYQPQHGKTIRSSVEISLEESLCGCKKTIDIKRECRCNCVKDDIVNVNCPKCQGTGKVLKTIILDIKIPQGILDGQTMKISGKGDVGDIGMQNGDIIITVHVRKNKKFLVKGNDVCVKTMLTFPEAVMGITKIVPTLYGVTECIIPPGTQSGTKICLKGQGIVNEKTHETGDQYVIVNVHIPKAENSEQLNVLQSLNEVFYKRK